MLLEPQRGVGVLEFVRQPGQSERLGDHLKRSLGEKSWTCFRAAVAFIKHSGTRHIAPALATFAQTAKVEIIVGVDHGGTSLEGLRDLLDAVSPTGRVLVFHNRLPFTFHPKLHVQEYVCRRNLNRLRQPH